MSRRVSLERSGDQPGGPGAGGVERREAAPLGVVDPQRQGCRPHPGADAELGQHLAPDRERLGVRPGHLGGDREHLAQRRRRAGGVEGAVEPVLGDGDQPGREVAHVDHRAREVELVGHDDPLPHRVGEPPRPVAGAARPVAGAADQAGAHDRGRAVGIANSVLAGDLRLAVDLHVGHQVAVERAAQRRVLTLLDRVEPRVDVAGRHQHPVPCGEVAHRPARVARMPGDVDDGVPASGRRRHPGRLEVAVGGDEGGAGRRVGAPPGQAGDVVAAPQRLLRHRATEPGRSPEHEHPHRVSQPASAGLGPAVSPRA